MTNFSRDAPFYIALKVVSNILFLIVCENRFLPVTCPRLFRTNPNDLKIFLTLRPFTQFKQKIKAIGFQNIVKICLLLTFHGCLNLILKDFQVWSSMFFQKDKKRVSQNMTAFPLELFVKV